VTNSTLSWNRSQRLSNHDVLVPGYGGGELVGVGDPQYAVKHYKVSFLELSHLQMEQGV
jgi:hypothetical protein